MKFEKYINNSGFLLVGSIAICLFLFGLQGCRKSEYNFVNNPAYLRVFNTLTYKIDVSTKGKPAPFLIMVMDPEFEENGTLRGGVVKGDFLDVRKNYSSPTSNAASTDYRNYEYPGALKIPIAPIINGFDLSNWAQVPSGKHRFVFYTRPQNSIPFFDLPSKTRLEQIKLADTVLNLAEGEVYTMNLLEKEFQPQKLITQVYLRQENFHKLALADSLNYLNFYNLSSLGYVQANPSGNGYDASGFATGTALKDRVNIFYSLFKEDVGFPYTEINGEPPKMGQDIVPGYQNIPLQQLNRSQEPNVAPYVRIPLFVGKDSTHGIFSNYWTRIMVVPNGGGIGGGIEFNPESGMFFTLTNTSDEGRRIPNNNYFQNTGFLLPSLIRQVASGPYKQRSFATVSSIEFINRKIYMTSVMKIYPAPILK